MFALKAQRHSEKNQCAHLWHKRQIRKSWGDKCAVSVCLPACSILESFSCPTFTSPSAMLLLNGSVRRAVHSPGLHSWSSEPLTYTKRDSQHRGTMRFSSKTQRYRDSWREDGYSLTGVERVTESWFLFLKKNLEPYWDCFCQTDSTKWKIHWNKTSASVHSKCRLQYTKVYQGHTSINRQNSLQLLLLHLKIYNKIYILKVYFTQLLPFSIV